ncbi:1-acyl-sn-glycerol-3-phosphate acyltransferase [Persicobacter sp. CCB-QB2]|uniref:lysophospholipid acyltransferase family protein n=1 Tax=Persicobacter sp. CCB-QB2 TaxID=1561025 RepID=UPI0006A99D61|nr:lysophospholipid acyltransferase family protein [Persicobacter sp. CCB-QB2]
MKNLVATVSGFFTFTLVMLLLFPLFALLSLKESWQLTGLRLYRFWGRISLNMAALPTRVIWKGNPLPSGQQCVIAANHGSYLDIPVIGSGPILTTFLGKHELTKIPVFGFIYRKFSIVVKRGNRSSAKQAIELCKKALDNGLNVAIFPEGTITKTPPHMGNFKDGAFIIAVDKQVPIVPVSMPYSWKILPRDDRRPQVHVHPSIMIIHEAIPTIGLSHDDIPRLKEQVKTIIEQEIKAYNKDEY